MTVHAQIKYSITNIIIHIETVMIPMQQISQPVGQLPRAHILVAL